MIKNEHQDGHHGAEPHPSCPMCAEATPPSKPLTRKQCIDALKELGYEGPTSYLMPKLRSIVELVSR